MSINNPIRYTDPTGHRPIIDNDENGNPILDPDWPPKRKPKNPQPPPPPVVPPSPPGGDPATPWDVGVEWLTGQGPRHHEFREGDPFTELLQLHVSIQHPSTG